MSEGESLTARVRATARSNPTRDESRRARSRSIARAERERDGGDAEDRPRRRSDCVELSAEGLEAARHPALDESSLSPTDARAVGLGADRASRAYGEVMRPRSAPPESEG